MRVLRLSSIFKNAIDTRAEDADLKEFIESFSSEWVTIGDAFLGELIILSEFLTAVVRRNTDENDFINVDNLMAEMEEVVRNSDVPHTILDDLKKQAISYNQNIERTDREKEESSWDKFVPEIENKLRHREENRKLRVRNREKDRLLYEKALEIIKERRRKRYHESPFQKGRENLWSKIQQSKILALKESVVLKDSINGMIDSLSNVPVDENEEFIKTVITKSKILLEWINVGGRYEIEKLFDYIMNYAAECRALGSIYDNVKGYSDVISNISNLVKSEKYKRHGFVENEDFDKIYKRFIEELGKITGYKPSRDRYNRVNEKFEEIDELWKFNRTKYNLKNTITRNIPEVNTKLKEAFDKGLSLFIDRVLSNTLKLSDVKDQFRKQLKTTKAQVESLDKIFTGFIPQSILDMVENLNNDSIDYFLVSMNYAKEIAATMGKGWGDAFLKGVIFHVKDSEDYEPIDHINEAASLYTEIIKFVGDKDPSIYIDHIKDASEIDEIQEYFDDFMRI